MLKRKTLSQELQSAVELEKKLQENRIDYNNNILLHALVKKNYIKM